ncbi:hypothetical protein IE4872_PB00111 (plasmid) [Rhizobium gallicum]|uniref:Uncharacterized protein n=2 Tax=Rhizobium gallicum TaxID=56730 RepID=A0A0B4X9U6_9HYPH|nr:hypothetical protein RGR602_PA00145 [Rhizobium gallicum bv. gallicum R602sp]APO69982.1 hypothetical protein IE4872_PB00111 [Rhizobium gallicum]
MQHAGRSNLKVGGRLPRLRNWRPGDDTAGIAGGILTLPRNSGKKLEKFLRYLSEGSGAAMRLKNAVAASHRRVLITQPCA